MISKATIAGERLEKIERMLEACVLCGHRCGVNREKGEKGVCEAGKDILISSYTAHHGEEPVFSGTKGSGTIFFTYCNLRCVFCQNHEISQEHLGRKVSENELAGIMLELQKKECHNINLVSPTHFMPQIFKALKIAFEKGLNVPVLYNTNGYDSIELLKNLGGVIDIYMPDFKYFNDMNAKKYSNADNYVETAKVAVTEMFRQVGNLVLDEDDVAKKGMLVRHLILPDDIASSKGVLKFLSSVSRDLWISIMSQYSPQYRACEHPEINRKIKPEEYWDVIKCAQELCLENYLIQEMSSTDVYLPDFKNDEPFKL